MKIVLASSNKNKIKEFKRILEPLDIELITQTELGVKEVPETGVSFEENSIIKSKNAYMQTNLPTIADDSGIEVDALNGEPGIFSARYAGEPSNDEENNKLLLKNLKNSDSQSKLARYQCVISYVDKDYLEKPAVFHAIWEGKITFNAKGTNGFGYDPIFYLDEYECTSAELDQDIKNEISHRAIALKKFEIFIKTHVKSA